MRIRSSLAVALLGLGLAAPPAEAQSCSVPGLGGSCPLNHSVSATVQTVATLTLSSASTPLLVTAADFAAGSKEQIGPIVHVVANTGWSLDVKSSAASWTGGDNDKPAGDLSINWDAGAYLAVSSTDQELATGSAGRTENVPTRLRTTWSYLSDPPGNYSLTLVFTLSAP